MTKSIVNMIAASLFVLVGAASGFAQQQEAAFTPNDKEDCLTQVRLLEDKSLAASLNADEFNLLIELLVSASEFCNSDSLSEAEQALLNASEIIVANS